MNSLSDIENINSAAYNLQAYSDNGVNLIFNNIISKKQEFMNWDRSR